MSLTFSNKSSCLSKQHPSDIVDMNLNGGIMTLEAVGNTQRQATETSEETDNQRFRSSAVNVSNHKLPRANDASSSPVTGHISSLGDRTFWWSRSVGRHRSTSATDHVDKPCTRSGAFSSIFTEPHRYARIPLHRIHYHRHKLVKNKGAKKRLDN